MNHEATRQHRRRTCSCGRLEALAASQRRLERKAKPEAGNKFTASLRRAIARVRL